MTEHPLLPLRVKSMTWLTPAILGLVLESLDGQALPPAEPGAHLDLKLPGGLSRSYSIVGHSGSARRYEIAVAKDRHSRGGSQFIHERLRVGDTLQGSRPRNLFALHEGPAPAVLLAGGIGITPLWSMVQVLEARQQAWTLHYASRAREHAAYLEEIETLAAQSRQGHLFTHFDDAQGRPMDLAQIFHGLDPATHVYCCGPRPMLDAFEKLASQHPQDHVHLERFSAAADTAPRDTFKVVLQQSGRTLTVPAASSILEVLLDNGIDAPYGCMQGTCGLCETPVLAGTPDHRDRLLSADTKASGRSLLICCSRSHTPELTLDL